MNDENAAGRRWYEGVTPYMWLVLLIASLGWIFDIFEGQIFVASMKEAMPSLLPKGTLEGTVDFYNNIALSAFLVGGALGGVLFGMLSDKIGRTRTMILTILMYSLFTAVTAFAQNWWQMTVLRFLVAMGTGGEWAVASAMVAEVFPKRARAWSLGIFHASSVLGTYMAVLAGAYVVGNYEMAGQLAEGAREFGAVFGPRVADYLAWFFSSPWRLGFLIGVLPALLTVWIRWKLREPEQWEEARERARADVAQRTGRVLDLFAPDLLRNTLVGLTLATVGLATFWGVHIYGRELLRNIVEGPYLADARPHIEQAAGVVGSRTDALLETHPEGVEPAEYQRVVDESAAVIRGALKNALEPYYEEAEPHEPKHEKLAKSVDDASEKVLKPLQAVAEGDRKLIEPERIAEAPGKVRKRMKQAFLAALPDAHKEAIKGWEMLGMFLVTTGGGLGLLSFGPICEWIGRRGTFLLFHLGGLVSALVVFQGMSDASPTALCWMLPVFGYLTLGMHAGYAIYFPELFPTRLRGTGGGFCFNGGRFLAASIIIIRGWMRSDRWMGLSLETTASILSLLFLVGLIVLLFAPETKGRDLPA